MKRPGLLMRAIERVILARPRWGMRRNSSRKLQAALGAIEQCANTRAKLAQYNMPDVLRLFDASLFCLMYDADLTVLSRDMTCRTDWWESRLYGRLLAMTMLECVEDIPAVLGKSFRESLAAVVSAQVHLKRVSEISKNLSDFRKQHEKELRQIRQVAAAHRDHNAKLLATLIEGLDIRGLMRLAGQLNDMLCAFACAMTQVLLEMNVVKEILKSFSKR